MITTKKELTNWVIASVIEDVALYDMVSIDTYDAIERLYQAFYDDYNDRVAFAESLAIKLPNKRINWLFREEDDGFISQFGWAIDVDAIKELNHV